MTPPAIGQRFTATWGSRYAVHRIDGDRVVLRDLDRPSACVIPTLVELETSGKYSADTTAEIAPTSAPTPASPQAALLLVELAPAATGGRRGDRRPSAKPAAPGAQPAAAVTSASSCATCGRGGHGVALAVVEIGGAEIAYCWRCYGVDESRGYGVTAHRAPAPAPPASPPAGALHTDWRPPPGEVYESRADVGSFDPPRPEDRRPPAPRPKPPPPPRVDAQTWLVGTGEVTR